MPPPELTRRLVEALLELELPRTPGSRLVLVHGRYAAGASPEFPVTVENRTTASKDQWRVRVVDEQSVLGVLDAWHAHRDRPGDDVLVVTTGVDDEHLGWDVRAHALRRTVLPVDRADIVMQRFGAAELDVRIRPERWLVDALLDAEPTTGWRRTGPVLTRDAAVRALLAARLGLGPDVPDAGTLLEWSQTAMGPARFAGLLEEERAGLADWLAGAVGGAAVVLMELVARGRAADAMALGIIARVLDQPRPSPEAVLAVGGLLGGARGRAAERRAFVEAVEGTLERWVAAAETGGAAGEAARRSVLDVVERADRIAVDAGLVEDLADDPFLPSGFRARLRTLAAALLAADAAIAGHALDALGKHRLARLDPRRYHTAEMAVRLLRWAAPAEPTVASVAAAVSGHVRDGGWVDRALTAVWAGDPVGDPVVGKAYQAVYDSARQRRDTQDEAFAQRLVTWTRHAATGAAGGALLIEDVLEEIVLPLVDLRPPLVLVLDGMSAAVAAELGEQLAARAWTEVSREAGRRTAAVATVPSITLGSRASLLSGRACTRQESPEPEAFPAFWRRHRRTGVLIHKAGIPGAAGHRLAEPLVEALAGDVVVGVVLNTIDDALDHGREGDRTGWRLGDVTHLPELLDAARSYGRPVVLVSDHGHVLERSTGADGPTAADGVESARWRTGIPGAGEVALSGPRVLFGDGNVVAPWREDIRYTRRRAGYHGGVSLAEMTVPVLVVLPAADDLPMGWSVLSPESTEPAWWSGRRVPERAEPRPTPPKPRRPRPVTDDAEGLFDVVPPPPSPAPTSSLGARVTASSVFDAQRKFVPKAPDKRAITAVVDALATADGRLSAAATAAAVGRVGRDPEFVIAMLQRLLNVEGYPVLSVDGSRTVRLDVDLLCLQFGVTAP